MQNWIFPVRHPSRTRQSQWLGQVRHALTRSAVSSQAVSDFCRDETPGTGAYHPSTVQFIYLVHLLLSSACILPALPCSHLGIAYFFFPLQSQPSCDRIGSRASIRRSHEITETNTIAMLRLSYWVFPIIGGLVWLGTLLGLFLHCTYIHTRHSRLVCLFPTNTVSHKKGSSTPTTEYILP